MHQIAHRMLRACLASLVTVAGLALPAVAAAGVTQSAAGQGTIFITTPIGSGNRTFSFNAETHSDGTTTGHAQLVNRFNGNITHIRVDCLRVVGNVASLSGTVTRSNNPVLEEFSSVVFTVQDNGEGAAAPPDMISFAFFDLPAPGWDCESQLFPPTFAIEEGNVQVNG